MTNIPSDDDFARAEKLSRESWRNLGEITKRVTQHIKRLCPLHSFHLLPDGMEGLGVRAYVFFEKNQDIKECESNGSVQAIKDFVYEELERQGRGKRGEITVVFEFDSDENVTKKYNGDYFLRLR